MKSIVCVLLLLLCWNSQAEEQQPQNVVFHAYPPDAIVAIRMFGNEYNPVGVADGKTPLTIPAEAFAPGYQFTYRLQHPHFTFPAKHDVKLESGRGIEENMPWEQTPVRGTPDSLTIGLLYGLRENLLIAVPLLLLGLGVATAAMVVWKRARSNKAYELRRQSLLAHSDMSDPLIGTTLGKYLLASLLGQGGMATVYKGVPSETLDTRDQVAIKVIQKQFVEDDEFRERFKREVQVSKRLDHPNIVRVDDFGEQDGLLYLALEYVDGQDLDSLIPRGGWSLEQAAPYLIPIVEGLIYAHEHNLVHRDLKPENIMVTRKNLVKIMDFGLARSVRGTSKVTKTGNAMGTPAYMSPEQIQGATPSPSMDQYSLGIMMYEMFTGRPPFESDNPMNLVMKHFTETPPNPAELKPSLNPVLCQIILRMLEKNPADRFDSLAIVKTGLENLQAHGTWQLPQPVRPQQPATPPPPTARVETQSSNDEGTIGFQVTSDEGTIGFQTPPQTK